LAAAPPPAPDAISATATIAPKEGFQMLRKIWFNDARLDMI
jgi:hypothetical protein